MTTDKPRRVAKALCHVIGHKWIPVWDGGAKAHGWPSMVCTRCHEPGWRVS